MDGKTIAVLGAGGHTGRFVVAELERRGVTVRPFTRSSHFTPIGREETPCAVLDFSQPDDLARALAGADAVINCAGPFLDTAEPAVEAAIRAGIPYLDLAAEQVTAQRLFERYDAPARAAGITILPAMPSSAGWRTFSHHHWFGRRRLSNGSTSRWGWTAGTRHRARA
ncbi:saccharopine dehydrogenase NADP-binding domain-containing protein [Oceanibaculum sp.]|uniref:saccharopine dehydrogenase NADP-binding domain-containing protein n=1 Tax=Oceanibaculum sp. TaxID=1903597 RepID=UPI002590977D|nr:saccharopine dehydrogenase NADP-binding domain-containing protein [Oceanibaculum sp.]MCH2395195.1 saccharopine dehydrogenase NADP-binding domain-containing protein [Oceanibaculum sp.]